MTTPRFRSLRVAAIVLAVALGAAAGANPAQAQAPSPDRLGDIVGTGRPGAIPDSYLVVLHETALAGPGHGVATHAADLATRYGGQVGHVYHAALTGFSVTMSEPAARRLAADPAVAYVEQDQLTRIAGTQNNPPSWGLDRIDQRNLPLNNQYVYPNTASNVRVYVLDTGIRTTHTDFGSRASHGRDTVDNDNNASDCHGHGTHVAGTIGGTAHGVAKAVRLVAVRVLNCAGTGTTAQIVAGVDWVTANAIRPAVANMSLLGGANTTIDNAVANSIASGISYALAAGNSNGANACNFSPARVPAAITVGATRINDARASFSNTGTCLDLFAPGESIRSAWWTSNTATSTLSGTSMAAPHVAGAAAMVLSANPGWTPAQVRTDLVNRTTTGVVTSPGSGSPNRLLFTGSGGAPPVITSLVCGFAGNNRFFCTLSATGGTQIRWTLSGTAVPAWNDETFIQGFCSGGSTPRAAVNVTVTNTHGSVSQGRTVICTGDPSFPAIS